MILSTVRRIFIIPVVAIAVVLVTTVTTSAMPLNLHQQHIGQTSAGLYTLKYVALGDSVAAGLGFASQPGASAEDIACGRSTEAYAYDVSAGINGVLAGSGVSLSATNAACQGATTKHMLRPQTLGSSIVKPQLDTAFEGATPALLTLTTGANDVRWATFLGLCFSAASCDTAENTAALESYIATVKQDMNTTMQNIRTRSHFLPPLVIATGYYTSTSTQCVNSNLTLGEVAWVEQATAKLNTAIKNATQGSYWFAGFAPVDFSGHDICSIDPWIQRPGVPGELAPFHPTTKGQEVIAKSILNTIGIPQ